MICILLLHPLLFHPHPHPHPPHPPPPPHLVLLRIFCYPHKLPLHIGLNHTLCFPCPMTTAPRSWARSPTTTTISRRSPRPPRPSPRPSTGRATASPSPRPPRISPRRAWRTRCRPPSARRRSRSTASRCCSSRRRWCSSTRPSSPPPACRSCCRHSTSASTTWRWRCRSWTWWGGGRRAPTRRAPGTPPFPPALRSPSAPSRSPRRRPLGRAISIFILAWFDDSAVVDLSSLRNWLLSFQTQFGF